jgi:lambda family phage portal protein
MIATTVESDLPPNDALKALAANDPLHIGGSPGASAVSPEAWLAARGEYYGEGGVKIDLTPGNVVHLMRGDKLRMSRPEAPGNTYDPFDRSLARDAAKSAGSAYEDLSGDYSSTSFSASRLAMELPWRIVLRRRQAIAEPFYRAAFGAWLEEACETGMVKLPKGAPAFWENPAAYTKAIWRGSAKPVSDPLKQAQADVLRLENGLTTFEAVLGENGMDFEETLAQQKSERQQRDAAGLPYPTSKSIAPSTPEDDDPALQ